MTTLKAKACSARFPCAVKSNASVPGRDALCSASELSAPVDARECEHSRPGTLDNIPSYCGIDVWNSATRIGATKSWSS